MKKYSLLENVDNSKFINHFKEVILDIFDEDLSIKNFYIKDFKDVNDVYLFTFNMSFYKKLDNKTFLSYQKLFNFFYENEIDFKYYDNTFSSQGLLSDFYDILQELDAERQSKKYNL